MSKITVISYANLKFKPHQFFNALTAKFIGKANKIILYGPKDLDEDFVNKNQETLSQKRGCGYWLWKPYLCVKTLEKMNFGDYLFYCDSGAYFVNNLLFLKDWMTKVQQDILPFSLSLVEKRYTKKDLFEYLSCEEPIYKETFQILGGYFMVKKTQKSIEFFNEYLTTSQQNKNLWPPYENELQDSEFIDHRHDQSVFSLLCKKYNILSWRDPSEWGDLCLKGFGNNYNDPINKKIVERILNSGYPRIVESCRRTNPIKYKIQLILSGQRAKKVKYQIKK